MGYELSLCWNAPLDVIVPRKIGAPYDPELAIGSVTEEGQLILDEGLKATLNVSQGYLERVLEEEKGEIQRRLALYRGGLPPLSIKGRTVVLTDDGIATGSTMKAALLSARAKGPKEIIIAAPVASPEAMAALEPLTAMACILEIPPFFMAVGQFYQNFTQTSDQTVCQLIKDSRRKIQEKEENHAEENPTL